MEIYVLLLLLVCMSANATDFNPLLKVKERQNLVKIIKEEAGEAVTIIRDRDRQKEMINGMLANQKRDNQRRLKIVMANPRIRQLLDEIKASQAKRENDSQVIKKALNKRSIEIDEIVNEMRRMYPKDNILKMINDEKDLVKE